MADNRIAYGIAKGMGIDTDGMEPKAVWQAIADKQGVSVEQAMQRAYAQKIKDSLNKRIAKASEELKKQSQMTAEEKIASVHIDFDKDNILPELGEDALQEIGLIENKPVLVKMSTIKRNAAAHPEVNAQEIDRLIGEALYSPQYLFKGNEEKPYYSFAKPMTISENNGKTVYGLVLLDVDNKKDNFEVVHWHWVRERSLKGMKK